MSANGPDDVRSNAGRRLDELLVAWEESLAAGKPLSPTDLCRDCRELAGELEREIARLKTVDRFLFSMTDQEPDRVDPAIDGSIPALSSYGLAGYELLEELGRGGMGIVYKARQKSLGRFV